MLADFAACQRKERVRNALRVRVGEKRILNYLHDTLERYIYTLASPREEAGSGSGSGGDGADAKAADGGKKKRKVPRRGRKEEL